MSQKPNIVVPIGTQTPADRWAQLVVDQTAYQILLPNADRDYIQRKIATEQQPYEAAMLADMRARLKQGELVLDVGANIGNHALYLASVVGCKVEAFEPNAALASALRRSIARNRLGKRLRVHTLGLGQAPAQASFAAAMPDNLGGQSLQLDGGDIAVQALDAFPVRGRVRAIKIDVEGMELDVLEGAARLVARHRPLLYVECANADAFRAVSQWMSARNYCHWDSFNATPTHLFLPTETVDSSDQLARLQTQLVQDQYELKNHLQQTRRKLDDANLKYRSAVESIASLKERVQAAESAHTQDVQAIATMKAALQDAEKTAGDADQLRESLASAHLKYRTATEQVGGLREQLQGMRDTAALMQQTMHMLQGQLTQSHAATDLQAEELTTIRQNHAQEITRLRQQADEQKRSVTEHLQVIREQADGFRRQHDDALAEIETLRQELSALAATHAESTTRLEQETLAHKQSTAALQSSTERAANLQRTLEQSKLQSVRQSMALNESRDRIAKLQSDLLLARQQVIRTRETLAYQLGHALIFGFKSFGAYVRLPGRLMEIRREAARRRAYKKQRPTLRPVPSIARPPSASAPAPAMRKASTLTPARLKSLKVAAIMDEFSETAYRAECDLLQLTPQHWQAELTQFTPDMLFIESAWRGKDNLWGNKVGHVSPEIIAMAEWCRSRKIPVVLWNKEDPVHFETFLNTARLADFVFTTDMDCIHRYKEALGHHRVYLLPFACQPLSNNPIEKYQRKDAFCFAGAYYARYPERTRDLGNFLASLPDFRPLEIYDRNFHKNEPDHIFPDEYKPFIVGHLPFEQIDRAHKGYRYAINLNSIKQSQTMFARRVYELLGSNTITLSNYARGLRLMFGDLVLSSDNGFDLLRRLRERCKHEQDAAKLRLAGLRKVMQEHTYQDRFAYVAAQIRGEELPQLLPCMRVLGYAKNDVQRERIVAQFERQSYPHKALLLVVPKRSDVESTDTIRMIGVRDAMELPLHEIGGNDDWLACMVAEDHYGEHYLTDLAVATRYAPGPVVGKLAHYHWTNEGAKIAYAAKQYQPVAGVPVRSGAHRLREMPQQLHDFVTTLYTAQFEHPDALSLDVFHYCKNGSGQPVEALVGDLPNLDSGLKLADILEKSEHIAPLPKLPHDHRQLDATQLAVLFARPAASSKLSIILQQNALRIDSALASDTHEYRYATQDYSPAELGAKDGVIACHLPMAPGLNVQLVWLFLDAAKERISHTLCHSNRNCNVEIPDRTHAVRLGLRVFGAGTGSIPALILGHRLLEPSALLGRAEHLLLTNHYPSSDDLYRNGFVHRRVVAYAQQGQMVDVFRLRPGEALGFHEFENVDCITGSQQALRQLLESGQYKSVLVHFLDPAMWGVLKDYIDRIDVKVWVHGAEIQPLHRREYNYTDPQKRQKAQLESERRMAFWRSVLQPMPPRLKLVFVSHYFAEEVMEDMGFRLPAQSYCIIHNPIDTTLFRYTPKPASARTKILSIRPYASAKYANDLSVKAILALKDKPYFNELQFHMVGDGPLFDTLLEPLAGLPNVTLERRFLSQPEIAQMHGQYGIFLCPTRMDAQGVSRDEAMASGLVPVTNAVAAIPEFVDKDCAVLAPAEDAQAMAEGIARLYENPDLFARMSAEAAARVARQTAGTITIAQELAFITDA